ncbi:MAG: ABC transporter permease, partial [Bacteroidota bacterium]
MVGLSIGTAVCLLIFVWVNNELSFDRDYPEANDIHRVICHWNGTGKVIHISMVTLAMVEQAVEEIPEINSFQLLRRDQRRPLVKTPEGEVFEERNMAFINDEWLETFDYSISAGTIEEFYNHKYSIALSEEQAYK